MSTQDKASWEAVQRAVRECLGDPRYAAGVLDHHLRICDECRGGRRCKWAQELARAAGDGREPEPGAEVRP
jgi:hypothetical protein